MPQLILRFDMRNPTNSVDPAFQTDKETLYKTAIDMAVWADEKGFDAIQLSEHHGSDDAYLPSPIVLAAAIAAKTIRIKLRFTLILLPFHNPLRLAEDLAVLDIISQGRVEVVFGAGYVPEEFAMFNIDPKQRGRIMENGIAAIKNAWSGKPFEFEGREVCVTPSPLQQPCPPIWMGGSSNAAAKRAARLCDYFFVPDPALYQVFRDEKIALGFDDPGPWFNTGTGFLVVSDDPDQTWQQMAPYILHETNSYGRWQQQGNTDAQYVEMEEIEPLKDTGLYPILTASDALTYIHSLGEDGLISLHPLISGLDPAIGWAQLNKFAEEILPVINGKPAEMSALSAPGELERNK